MDYGKSKYTGNPQYPNKTAGFKKNMLLKMKLSIVV
jgi:hypothetical protein